jgi:hypothetical protein
MVAPTLCYQVMSLVLPQIFRLLFTLLDFYQLLLAHLVLPHDIQFISKYSGGYMAIIRPFFLLQENKRKGTRTYMEECLPA